MLLRLHARFSTRSKSLQVTPWWLHPLDEDNVNNHSFLSFFARLIHVGSQFMLEKCIHCKTKLLFSCWSWFVDYVLTKPLLFFHVESKMLRMKALKSTVFGWLIHLIKSKSSSSNSQTTTTTTFRLFEFLFDNGTSLRLFLRRHWHQTI